MTFSHKRLVAAAVAVLRTLEGSENMRLLMNRYANEIMRAMRDGEPETVIRLRYGLEGMSELLEDSLYPDKVFLGKALAGVVILLTPE